MRAFLRLTWKEARELLRPRYIIPILFVPLMFVAMGQGIGGIEDELSQQPTVGIVNNDTGQYGASVVATFRANANLTYSGTNVSASTALNRTKAGGGEALVVIPDGFTERIRGGEGPGGVHLYAVVDSIGISGLASPGKVQSVLSRAGQGITLDVTGAAPSHLAPIETTYTTFVKGQRIDEPPSVLSEAMTSQFIFIPVVIMVVIIFSGQMVMNSMGIEKENKTLETLLTMPVKRRTIVAAKLVGSASIGLLAAAVMSGSLFYYQSSLSVGDGGGGAGLEAFSLGGLDFVLVGASLFFSVLIALALALCMGIFAGDRQGAQILLFPLMILAGGPAFATMFVDVTTLSMPVQTILLAIPFTHPALAPKELMFGSTGLVVGGIVYQAIIAAATIAFAIYLFNSDRVVTGNAGRIGRWLTSMQR
jgi:ABC-2 type transport system permease protein